MSQNARPNIKKGFKINYKLACQVDKWNGICNVSMQYLYVNRFSITKNNILICVLFCRLGRSECLEDLWIAGEFDISGIKYSELAKKESERLANEAQLAIDSSFYAKDSCTFITFLNARSLRKHQQDIMNDPELMKSAILGIAETHLNEYEEVHLEGFEGSFVNGGKGKGVAAFIKVPIIASTKTLHPSFSAILLELENIKIAFVYMASQTNMEEVNLYLGPMLQDKEKPTIIFGDMNFHFTEKQHQLKSFFEDLGFQQIIDKVTHDEGHTIDHIYTSDLRILSKENVFLKTLYFSDHDALSIRFEN